jgi:hypothetical protein
MKVLVACEYSQVVTKAFRERGHEAYSCDLLPSEGNPKWHIQDDVLRHLDDGWDIMIAHPPCTRICNSGVRWLEERNLWEEMRQGALFFRKLLDARINKKGLENPIPHHYALDIIGRKYDQIVQPYHFGDKESKATCLWLVNLPPLLATFTGGEGIQQSVFKQPPSANRGHIRSRTFPGIAKAMAEQWG